jgi:DNA-binding protein HU-beta
VNKNELIEAVASQLEGGKKQATEAVEAVLETIKANVAKGEKVSIAGFGVFEKRLRAARVGRNPQTGAAVKVKAKAVPGFRAGAAFKDHVAAGKATAKKATATVKATAKKAAPAKTVAKKAAPAKTVAKKAPAKKAPAKTVAKKAAPAKTVAKKAPAKKAPAKTVAKKAPAKKAPAKKAAAKR